MVRPVFMANMAAIAAEGDGRFYDSESASELPSIFLDESQTQLQPWIVQERFHPPPGRLRPPSTASTPRRCPLDGYVASTPKPTSQVVLSGPGGDPVLAQWQYGLGTALAWTSDTEGRWTAELLSSPVGRQAVRRDRRRHPPLAAAPPWSVSAQVEGDRPI